MLPTKTQVQVLGSWGNGGEMGEHGVVEPYFLQGTVTPIPCQGTGKGAPYRKRAEKKEGSWERKTPQTTIPDCGQVPCSYITTEPTGNPGI